MKFKEFRTAINAAPSLKSHIHLTVILALFQGIRHDQVAVHYGRSRRTIQNFDHEVGYSTMIFVYAPSCIVRTDIL